MPVAAVSAVVPPVVKPHRSPAAVCRDLPASTLRRRPAPAEPCVPFLGWFMRKILVVEDSAIVLKVLKHLLGQNPGLQPFYADSFAAAQALMAAHADFFAALVDLNLPDAPEKRYLYHLLASHEFQ